MDGAVQTYKARLTAKGYTQTPWIDYEETFSPFADIRAIRILIAIAAFYDYEIWQMDVKTAFLNGYLSKEVYMKQPEGFVNPKYPNRKFGFTQNRDEPCVYLKASGSNVTFLILYVDDILIMGNNIPMLKDVKSYLGRCFAMKDLGEAAYILGIKIYRDRSQRLIEKLRLSKSQGASTPAELKRMKNVPYASAMGSIMYVVRCTRPDVAFAQNITSRFQQNPSDLHWTTVKNILKYLRNTKDMFLVYGGAVDWKSAKQSIFATSSAEAEYIAAYDASKEAVWVRKFISGLGVVPTIEEPISYRRGDSLSALVSDLGFINLLVTSRIAWDKVLSSSEFGGINIGSLKALNWSLLAKWWCRFKTKKNSLWKKVVCSFHGSDGNLGVASDVGSPDSWRWSLHPSGQFSVYGFRAVTDSKLLGHLGSKLRWNNLVPGKINILAWTIRNYRLPTRANIDKRGIDIHSILCPFCEEQIKDEDHIFALCPFSRNIWDLIRKWWGLDVIPLDTTLNVLEMDDDGDLNFGEKISYLFDVVYLCAKWWIWRARNLLVFQAVKVNMINIIDDIITTSYLWIKNRAKCCSISWVDWCCNPSIICILL
ncbi:retrotransposon protein, putative, ty1-copia subclass [Tanacetum coccineum]